MSVAAAGLSLLAIALLGPVSYLLPRARWAAAEPRATLILWQAVGLSAGLAALGAVAAAAVAPLHPTLFGGLRRLLDQLLAGQPTGGLDPLHTTLLAVAVVLGTRLFGTLALSTWRTVRARGRHRRLVDLIGRPLTAELASRTAERDGSAGYPTAALAADADDGLVLDHPRPAAYCLPGGTPRVVLTSGALALFDDEELAAVLAHEHAHLTERHDLVVLPFAAWSAALPWLPTVRACRGAVDRLIEMVADDRACAHCDRAVLACALARFGGAGAPAGALAATGGGQLSVRIGRLLDPPVRSRALRVVLLALAAALLVMPTLSLLLAAL
ncbi:MAG: M56 family metallopeptidase [Actinocatenispora sp.]